MHDDNVFHNNNPKGDNILNNIISNIRPLRTITMISLVMTAGLASFAQAATSLPGGASSLTETYGNWTVSCIVQTQGENKNVACTMSQQQVDEKKQRALAVELGTNKDGAAGVFVLPFGLNLSAGTVFQIDEDKADDAVAFSTCLPAGCIVPAKFDTAKTDALSKGKNLAIVAQAMDGKNIKLNVSLEGFSGALKRVRELVK